MDIDIEKAAKTPADENSDETVAAVTEQTTAQTADRPKKKNKFAAGLAAYFKTFFKYNVEGRRSRIWEIDFWRGLLIIGVTIMHVSQYMGDTALIQYSTDFGNNLSAFVIKIWSGNYARALSVLGVYFFVALSGLSCSFTRNHAKRALKFIIFTVIFMFALTLLVWIFFHELTFNFNIIFVLMICSVTWWLFELLKAPDWVRLLIGSVAITIGIAYFHGYFIAENVVVNNHFFGLFVYNYQIIEYCSRFDFQPIFPHLGIFLFAAVLGKHLYKDKKTLTTREYPPKWLLPALWCGKHSLLVYLSFPIYVGIIMLIAKIF